MFAVPMGFGTDDFKERPGVPTAPAKQAKSYIASRSAIALTFSARPGANFSTIA